VAKAQLRCMRRWRKYLIGIEPFVHFPELIAALDEEGKKP
jgi:hypothetical protein